MYKKYTYRGLIFAEGPKEPGPSLEGQELLFPCDEKAIYVKQSIIWFRLNMPFWEFDAWLKLCKDNYEIDFLINDLIDEHLLICEI